MFLDSLYLVDLCLPPLNGSLGEQWTKPTENIGHQNTHTHNSEHI